MTISEAAFVEEKELHEWVGQNISHFLPGSIFLRGFQVTTVSGKHGVPDGFAFDFKRRDWCVIEVELLRHGVWPHIAEQIVRFVVALQNPSTRRKIRDRVFDHVLSSGSAHDVAVALSTTPERLLQQLETFIETVSPRVLIFIDETNQDLTDMAYALSSPASIFRVRKFIVNGRPEYYSPDGKAPVIDVVPSGDEGGGEAFDILEALGGGALEVQSRRFKAFRLNDGSLVTLKRSKYYEDKGYYWYGINKSTLDLIRENGVTHIVFGMGSEGFAKVPLETVEAYLADAYVTENPDGSIRHYHCLVSPPPEAVLFTSAGLDQFPLKACYQAL